MSGGARWAAAIGAAALMLLVVAAPAVARLRWSDCGDVEAECARAARAARPQRRGDGVGVAADGALRRAEPAPDAALPVRRAGRRGGARVRRRAVRGRRPRRSDFAARLLRPARHGRLRAAALPGARARPAAALDRAPARTARGAWARGARSTARASPSRTSRRCGRRSASEKLTLFGISYGTKLALAYARAHPDHVERMALDSVLEPDDADVFGLEPYRAMAATLAALCPRALPRRDRRPGGRPRPAGRPAARARRCAASSTACAGAGAPATLTALALVGPDVRLRLQPGDPRRHPGRGAGRARPRRPGAAAAPRRQRRRALASLPEPRSFSAARYATVCEETPLPWPRGAPFGERAQRARGGGRLGPGAFFPFAYEEARADEIDLCLRWPEASRRRRPGRRVPGGAVAHPPGRGGPAHAAGGLGARRGGAAGAQRVVVPGVGHAVVGGDPSRCGIRRLFAFLRGRPAAAACPRVATLVPAIGVPPTSLGQLAPAARRARAGGADGGGARRHARRPDLRAVAGARLAAVGRRAARRDVPPAAALDRAAAPAGRPGRPRQRRCCRGAGARGCGSPARPAAARPGADLAERRGARAARRPARARAAAGGAAAAGGERCAKLWRSRRDSGTERPFLPSDAPRSFPSTALRSGVRCKL